MKRYGTVLWACLLLGQGSYVAWADGRPMEGGEGQGSGQAIHSRGNSSGRTHGGRQGRVSVVPTQHVRIVNNTRVIRNINHYQRAEVIPNRYYWHTTAGVRYAHYYSGGHHWYGFYDGPRFYWTRYHANHWWWYDTAYARWSFWAGGYWWWAAPTGVMYVYVNNGYTPYQEAVVPVAQPQVPPPLEQDPIPTPNADGTPVNTPISNAPPITSPPLPPAP